MKYRTFQYLLIGGGVVIAFGLLFAAKGPCEAWIEGRAEDERREERERELAAEERWKAVGAQRAERSRGSSGAGAGAGAPAGASAGAATHEARLRALLGEPAGGEEKRKDAVPGRVKVNLYAEGGVWARAKVDLDRDDRWDEKWRIEGGAIYRQVASADDEAYGPEALLDPPAPPESNVPSDSQPGSAVAAADPGAADELRDVDRLMLELLARPVQAKIKDASKGRPFKINLYSDGGARFERAKVDLDRDDKWDEKWTFAADGGVVREVSPGDDERYSERFALEAGARWVASP